MGMLSSVMRALKHTQAHVLLASVRRCCTAMRPGDRHTGRFALQEVQMFNRSTRSLILSALPVILAVTSLAPAGGTASAAGPDGGTQLTLHLAGGDQNMFNVAGATVTDNRVTVTLSSADSQSSFDLANIGALGGDIPSMVLDGQGCKQQFNDARVESITFAGGATPTTSVEMTATAQGPAKCQNAGAKSAWNQVTNQPSSPAPSGSQTTSAAPTTTTDQTSTPPAPPANVGRATAGVGAGKASGINVDPTAPTTTTGDQTSTVPAAPATVGAASAGVGAGKASGINVDPTAPTTTTGGQTSTASAPPASFNQITNQAPTP
jgi:hypothetical protein